MKTALALHVLAGICGLVLGPVAMGAKKRKGLHTRAGFLYFVLMTCVCLSGAALAALSWQRNWWLFPVAVFSYSFCLRGYWAEKKRGLGWLRAHISGMLGSYAAMSTAFIVVNATSLGLTSHVPAIVFWVLPTLVAVPLIKRAVARHGG